jgi:hypothetical protein
MTTDPARIRREHLRWNCLLTLNNARPIGAFCESLLAVAQAVYPDATSLEVRQALDYLEARDLVEIDRQPHGRWHVKLSRYGIDIAEYTVSCEPGIARPEKYW